LGRASAGREADDGEGMTDWYYHAPGQGRVGPLTADEMRACYRERRIARDTLAWHEGLREWQPLERLIEELGLTGVQPDMSRPPPPPPIRPTAATASHAARPSVPVEPPPSNRTGCIIAVIVVGFLGLFLIGILAAIALPAYNDYVKRSKAAQTGQAAPDAPLAGPKVYAFDPERMEDTDALARDLITLSMREFYAANSNTCPDTLEFERMMVRYPRYQGSEEDGWFGIDPARPISGVCAYAVRFNGLGPEVIDKTVQYDVTITGDDVTVYCRNIDLPAGFAPPRCGA
jgi:type IV pilus assembly protein PilA